MNNKQNKSLFIERIETLIRKNSRIPYHEIMRLMMKSEKSPGVDLKKELEIISKKYDKDTL